MIRKSDEIETEALLADSELHGLVDAFRAGIQGRKIILVARFRGEGDD